MKIVLWIGKEANQIALAEKIGEKFNVVGIVFEKKISIKPSKLNLRFYFNKLIEKFFINFISKTWSCLLAIYKSKIQEQTSYNFIEVDNINNEQTKIFTESLNVDLILVSGTFLIRSPLINNIKSTIGIINLHTGLSPYIKGGPNCTNWCISTNQFEYIGNTIMWLNEGIDTGNILITETTKLSGNETFLELHYKVMEHAHEICLKAIQQLYNGEFNSTSQKSIAKGKTYYTKEWDLKAKFNLKKNWKNYPTIVQSNDFSLRQSKLHTVNLK